MKKYIVVFSNLFKYIFGPILCFHYIVAQQVYDDLDFLVLLSISTVHVLFQEIFLLSKIVLVKAKTQYLPLLIFELPYKKL